MENKIGRQGLIYRAFRGYVRFVNDRLFYRKAYYLDTENIPPCGTPTLIVSNHQNCLNDALGIALSFNDRKPQFIVRADVFNVHPLADRFLRRLGLLPAYRLNFDGETALSKNDELFEISENELINGATVVMFPEGTHQDKHWLGDFSQGYLKLAFEAAEKADFQKDILIVPACNHYSGYFGLQEDMLVKYGKPISLQPFYELYRTKPRTAKRQVNEIVRQQISGMMLNITDLDNYEAFDFLRKTYGKLFAPFHGYNADYLPDKLLADKELFDSLNDGSDSNRYIYQEAARIAGEIKKNKMHVDDVLRPPKPIVKVLRILRLVALFPLWLFAFVPNIIIYLAPKLFMRRFRDKMFTNTVFFAMSVLITMPLSYLTLFFLTWHFINIWVAIVYTLSLPYLGLFAWHYSKWFRRVIPKDPAH